MNWKAAAKAFWYRWQSASVGECILEDRIEKLEENLNSYWRLYGNVPHVEGYSHIDRLEAQIRDRDTLLRNENENYRRVCWELDKFKNCPEPVAICNVCDGLGKKVACPNCTGKGWVRC